MFLHLSVSHSVWGEAGVRSGETATEAGGTHPTGMYSCVLLLLGLKYLFT